MTPGLRNELLPGLCVWYIAGRMRYIPLIALMALATVLPAAYAESDEPVSAAKAKTKTKELAPIPALLAEATYLTRKKPNLKAKYYGFIRSASWCVPCQVFVPQLLKDYGKMKSAKMELILLGQEEEAVVKKYMKDHDYDIPGVMPSELGTVPGLSYEGLGYPSMCIVDAEGNFIASNGGTNMMKWRDILKEHKKQLMKEKREARARKGE